MIVTSQMMTAEEAIDLYYSRNSSEKYSKVTRLSLETRSIKAFMT